MHVTHVVAHPPFIEGIGTAAYYNAAALRELGCDVTVYTTRLPTTARSEDLDFYRFMPRWASVGNAFLTPDLLRMQRTDLIHLHFPFITGSELALLKARASGKPVVVTYHNDLIGGGVRRPSFFVYNRLMAPRILLP